MESVISFFLRTPGFLQHNTIQYEKKCLQADIPENLSQPAAPTVPCLSSTLPVEETLKPRTPTNTTSRGHIQYSPSVKNIV